MISKFYCFGQQNYFFDQHDYLIEQQILLKWAADFIGKISKINW
jgi:hypothetical protein